MPQLTQPNHLTIILNMSVFCVCVGPVPVPRIVWTEFIAIVMLSWFSIQRRNIKRLRCLISSNMQGLEESQVSTRAALHVDTTLARLPSPAATGDISFLSVPVTIANTTSVQVTPVATPGSAPPSTPVQTPAPVLTPTPGLAGPPSVGPRPVSSFFVCQPLIV